MAAVAPSSAPAEDIAAPAASSSEQFAAAADVSAPDAAAAEAQQPVSDDASSFVQAQEDESAAGAPDLEVPVPTATLSRSSSDSRIRRIAAARKLPPSNESSAASSPVHTAAAASEPLPAVAASFALSDAAHSEQAVPAAAKTLNNASSAASVHSHRSHSPAADPSSRSPDLSSLRVVVTPAEEPEPTITPIPVMQLDLLAEKSAGADETTAEGTAESPAASTPTSEVLPPTHGAASKADSDKSLSAPDATLEDDVTAAAPASPPAAATAQPTEAHDVATSDSVSDAEPDAEPESEPEPENEPLPAPQPISARSAAPRSHASSAASLNSTTPRNAPAVVQMQPRPPASAAVVQPSPPAKGPAPSQAAAGMHVISRHVVHAPRPRHHFSDDYSHPVPHSAQPPSHQPPDPHIWPQSARGAAGAGAHVIYAGQSEQFDDDDEEFDQSPGSSPTLQPQRAYADAPPPPLPQQPSPHAARNMMSPRTARVQAAHSRTTSQRPATAAASFSPARGRPASRTRAQRGNWTPVSPAQSAPAGGRVWPQSARSASNHGRGRAGFQRQQAQGVFVQPGAYPSPSSARGRSRQGYDASPSPHRRPASSPRRPVSSPRRNASGGFSMDEASLSAFLSSPDPLAAPVGEAVADAEALLRTAEELARRALTTEKLDRTRPAQRARALAEMRTHAAAALAMEQAGLALRAERAALLRESVARGARKHREEKRAEAAFAEMMQQQRQELEERKNEVRRKADELRAQQAAAAAAAAAAAKAAAASSRPSTAAGRGSASPRKPQTAAPASAYFAPRSPVKVSSPLAASSAAHAQSQHASPDQRISRRSLSKSASLPHSMDELSAPPSSDDEGSADDSPQVPEADAPPKAEGPLSYPLRPQSSRRSRPASSTGRVPASVTSPVRGGPARPQSSKSHAPRPAHSVARTHAAGGLSWDEPRLLADTANSAAASFAHRLHLSAVHVHAVWLDPLRGDEASADDDAVSAATSHEPSFQTAEVRLNDLPAAETDNVSDEPLALENELARRPSTPEVLGAAPTMVDDAAVDLLPVVDVSATLAAIDDDGAASRTVAAPAVTSPAAVSSPIVEPAQPRASDLHVLLANSAAQAEDAIADEDSSAPVSIPTDEFVVRTPSPNSELNTASEENATSSSADVAERAPSPENNLHTAASPEKDASRAVATSASTDDDAADLPSVADSKPRAAAAEATQVASTSSAVQATLDFPVAKQPATEVETAKASSPVTPPIAVHALAPPSPVHSESAAPLELTVTAPPPTIPAPVAASAVQPVPGLSEKPVPDDDVKAASSPEAALPSASTTPPAVAAASLSASSTSSPIAVVPVPATAPVSAPALAPVPAVAPPSSGVTTAAPAAGDPDDDLDIGDDLDFDV